MSSLIKHQPERKDSGNTRGEKGRRGSVPIVKSSPFGKLLENVKSLASSKGLWNEEMQRDLPKKWEKHGDMIVFPQNSFTHTNWRYLGRELWSIVAESLNVARLGRKRLIADDENRTPHVDILFGDNGWVEYTDESGIIYNYDASKRVFNNSKNKERQRISHWNCHGEVIVDMYAGLGYYTFPFLVSCQAKKVYAIDWDEDMVEALLRSATANQVEARIEVLQGDTRRVAPVGVADRVYLGLVPSCRAHWLVACKTLKASGGMIHIHDTIHIGAKYVKIKETPRSLPKLPSVSEEISQSEQKSDGITSSASSSTEEVPVNDKKNTAEAQQPIKKKFSRSASIVEEMENRIIPDPKILSDFEHGIWGTLPENYKEYALDCATSCTRFLNNIHLADSTYTVTIINITRYPTNNSKVESIVLDLLCCTEDSSVEKLAAKFMSTNLS